MPHAPGSAPGSAPEKRQRWLSLLTVAYGAAVFVWLTPESDSVALTALLGVCGAALGAAHLSARYLWTGHKRLPWLGLVERLALPLWGALAGAGGALLAAGLMFLKTALHAHPYPDFSPLLMLAVIGRAPAGGAAGALAGLGLRLVRGALWRGDGM